jgi:hypothetical protein
MGVCGRILFETSPRGAPASWLLALHQTEKLNIFLEQGNSSYYNKRIKINIDINQKSRSLQYY